MGRLRIGAALSEHPLATHAVGECVGHLLERVGPEPDLLVVAVTPPLLGALDDVVGAARGLLGPSVVVGVGAAAVLGGPREVEGRAAVAMFAVASGGPGPVARPVRLEARHDLDHLRGLSGTLLLFVDPLSVQFERLVEHLVEAAPDLLVLGGTATGAQHAGGNRLLLDGATHTDGAVGVLLAPSVPVRAVVSQGVQPVGPTFTVTGVEGQVLTSLAGAPALDRLDEVRASILGEVAMPAREDVLVGRVVDAHLLDVGRGDLLARRVRSVDAAEATVTVDGQVALGDVVQFLVRDAATATDDLRELVGGESAAGAFVLTSTARGLRLFGEADHDAGIVDEALDGAPLAGVFCGAEAGPVGGTSFAHTSSATVVLFG